MLRIRQNIFETNSSSAHSIVILNEVSDNLLKRNKNKDSIRIYENNKELELQDTDVKFYCDFKVLTSIGDKIGYAMASYEDRDKIQEELEEILSKYTNGEITKITIYDEKFGETVYPHVDHQSIGTLEFFLKNNNITLEEFICDPKYIVIIDKDGAGVLYNLKIVGMIKEQYK